MPVPTAKQRRPAPPGPETRRPDGRSLPQRRLTTPHDSASDQYDLERGTLQRAPWLSLSAAPAGVGGVLLGIAAAIGAAPHGPYSLWTSIPAIIAYVLFGLAILGP